MPAIKVVQDELQEEGSWNPPPILFTCHQSGNSLTSAFYYLSARGWVAMDPAGT